MLWLGSGSGKKDQERDEQQWRETTGHDKKLIKTRCLTDIRKHSFPDRYVNTWNELEKEKIKAKSVHDFEVIY